MKETTKEVIKGVLWLIAFMTWLFLTMCFIIPYVLIAYEELITVLKPFITKNYDTSLVLLLVWGILSVIMFSTKDEEDDKK